MTPDPIQLLTALQEIAPDILTAARSRAIAERSATGAPGPTGDLAAELAANAMADQGEQQPRRCARIVAAHVAHARPERRRGGPSRGDHRP